MKRPIKISLIIALLAAIFLTGLYTNRDKLTQKFFEPTETTIQSGIPNSANEVIAQNLSIPWEIVELPDDQGVLVTERTGNLTLIGKESKTTPVSGVEHVGEGGLLGLALHPQFEENNWLYLYLTTRSGENLINRVERYVYRDGGLSEKRLILDEIPGASFHDGGRIAFGPDRLLYITTGDAGNEQAAQDTKSLSGKILRIEDDGEIPSDNLFNNPVYSYGHRNPQGLAWDESNQLWSSEHGRSGLKSGFDEINLIQNGNNYGWPIIEGDETLSGMVGPALHSGAAETWAPGGLAYANGHLFMGGLRGQALYQVKIDGDKISSIKSNFSQKFGRIRTTVAGIDNKLYIATSNTDGRGEKKDNDDVLLRFDVNSFGTN